jgi:hypothetical protein
MAAIKWDEWGAHEEWGGDGSQRGKRFTMPMSLLRVRRTGALWCRMAGSGSRDVSAVAFPLAPWSLTRRCATCIACCVGVLLPFCRCLCMQMHWWHKTLPTQSLACKDSSAHLFPPAPWLALLGGVGHWVGRHTDSLPTSGPDWAVLRKMGRRGQGEGRAGRVGRQCAPSLYFCLHLHSYP